MKTSFKLFLLCVLMSMSFMSFSQDWSKAKLDPIKEKKYLPYMELKHGGPAEFPTWKENNKYQYIKEMWYYSESFYVKRNHLSKGVALDESIFDVSRFENQRKQNEETIIVLDGFKDAIVLKPAKDLFYIAK